MRNNRGLDAKNKEIVQRTKIYTITTLSPPMPEFKYIVRLLNTDLDGNRPVAYALTGIKGVGYRLAAIVADAAHVSREEKIGNLSDEKIQRIADVLHDLPSHIPSWALSRRKDTETGKDTHICGPDLSLSVRDDINLLKKIRAYRGIRHERGHRVRGQRTRSHGRTGLTVGVSRRAKR